MARVHSKRSAFSGGMDSDSPTGHQGEKAILGKKKSKEGVFLVSYTNHTKQADQVGADHFTGDPDPVHRGFPGIWDTLKIK